MLIKESLKSATISIRTNIVRSILTALAIIIGTAAVIAVIGIGSSANKALEAQIDDFGPRTLVVSPGQNRRGAVTKGLIPLDIKDAEALQKNNDHNWLVSPYIARNRQGNSTPSRLASIMLLTALPPAPPTPITVILGRNSSVALGIDILRVMV